MSTSPTPIPAAPPPTGVQTAVANIEQGIMQYLSPASQTIVGLTQILGTPNQDKFMQSLATIGVLTNVAATIPNSNVQAIAGLASVIESIVGATVNLIKSIHAQQQATAQAAQQQTAPQTATLSTTQPSEHHGISGFFHHDKVMAALQASVAPSAASA